MLVFGYPDDDGFSLQAWIAQWAIFAERDPVGCMKTLFLLGYDCRPDRGISVANPLHSIGIAGYVSPLFRPERSDYLTLAVLSPSPSALDSLLASIGVATDPHSSALTFVAICAEDMGVVLKLVSTESAASTASFVASCDAVLLVNRTDVVRELEGALQLDSAIPKTIPRILLCVNEDDASDAISVARQRNHIETEGGHYGGCVKSISRGSGQSGLQDAAVSALQNIKRMQKAQQVYTQGIFLIASVSVTVALFGLVALSYVKEKKTYK